MIFDGPIQAHCIIIYDPTMDKSSFEDMEQWLKELAMSHRGNILHILMPAVEATAEIREYFGVTQAKLPTVVFSDMRDASNEKPQGTQHLLPKNTAFGPEALAAFDVDCLQKHEDVKKKAKKQKNPSGEL